MKTADSMNTGLSTVSDSRSIQYADREMFVAVVLRRVTEMGGTRQAISPSERSALHADLAAAVQASAERFLARRNKLAAGKVSS